MDTIGEAKMSRLDGADSRRTANGREPPDTTPDRVARVGAYLTDGVFLYRIAGLANGGEIVEVEDCLRLDVVPVRYRDFCARRLRVVTRTPVDA